MTRTILTILVLVVGGGYLLLMFSLWARQERVVFQPPRVTSDSLTLDSGVRRVSYRAPDDAELVGYLVGDPSTSRGLLIAFHGNADLARWLIPWAQEVARRTHVAVLLPELRGYDGIPGAPTYAGAAEDARAALAFATRELHVDSLHLVYFGHSLGSAMATELAAEHPPRVLILQSPLSSARAMARRMGVPGIDRVWRLISRVHYDTERRVGTLDTPVWVVHGDRDFIIPSAMGRSVFAAARHPGELLIVAGAGHNDVPSVGGEAYWRWLGRAVDVGLGR